MIKRPLPHDSSVCSLDTLTISGIKTFFYNLSELPQPSITNPKDVAVLFILHGRTRDNSFSKAVAYNVQEVYKAKRTKGTLPLICVSFDLRNHGERLVDLLKNQTWSQGNKTHAMDLCSFIDGTVQDCQLLIDYLPLLYPGYNFRNFVTGNSLGGHICFRLATDASRKIELIIPVVGCTDLTSLLVNRAKGKTPETAVKDLRKLSYEDLKLTEEQKVLWPGYFHNYVSKQDYQVAENFPNHVKVFAIFGKLDTTVPPLYSEDWFQDMESARCFDGSIIKHVFEDVGHDQTKEMCQLYSKWLVETITF